MIERWCLIHLFHKIFPIWIEKSWIFRINRFLENIHTMRTVLVFKWKHCDFFYRFLCLSSHRSTKMHLFPIVKCCLSTIEWTKVESSICVSCQTLPHFIEIFSVTDSPKSTITFSKFWKSLLAVKREILNRECCFFHSKNCLRMASDANIDIIAINK